MTDHTRKVADGDDLRISASYQSHMSRRLKALGATQGIVNLHASRAEKLRALASHLEAVEKDEELRRFVKNGLIMYPCYSPSGWKMAQALISLVPTLSPDKE